MESFTGHGRPVFVDETGRRCTIVRSVGRLIAVATIGFVGLGSAALSVSPSVARPVPHHGSAISPRIITTDGSAIRP